MIGVGRSLTLAPRALWSSILALEQAWRKDRVPVQAAALAYYAIFALIPILLLALSVGGRILGGESARAQLTELLEAQMGNEAIRFVQPALDAFTEPKQTAFAGALALLALLYASSASFRQLHGILNAICGLEPRPWWALRSRLRALLGAAVTVLVLLIALLGTSALAALSRLLEGRVPGGDLTWEAARTVGTWFLVTLAFLMAYRVVPDCRLPWRSAALGALVGGLFFALLQSGFSYLVVFLALSSIYGAAGSVFVVLAWIYYSAQTFLLGVEVAKVAERPGAGRRP